MTRCVNYPDSARRPHDLAEHGRCEHGYRQGSCAITPTCPGAPAEDPLGLDWRRA